MTNSYQLHRGDCTFVLELLDDASIDAIVTDPPYHLTSIVKRFGGPNAAPAKFGTDGAFARASKGFMGKEWDGGDLAFQADLWAEALRVLKPGGHLIAFGGTRTYHRLAVAIEDAGFEIRDSLAWIYRTGFPKSHDVSKGIDKILGGRRELVRPKSVIGHQRNIGNRRPYMDDPDHMTVSDVPATPEAAKWQGWGTAAKPAVEPIALARKPLSGTVAANVLAHGTGAINIDACRVSGRWPANVISDGSAEDLGGYFQIAKPSPSERAGNAHPTVKPVALMRYLCRLVTPPGGLVLDPFTGSGTTGVAALLEGFRFVGIEREAEYAEIAERRLADALPDWLT